MGSEQQDRGGLISRCRKIENSKWNYLLRNQQLSSMQNKECIALPDVELDRLNCYLPCFRRDVNAHGCVLRTQFHPSGLAVLEFKINSPRRLVPILRAQKIDHKQGAAIRSGKPQAADIAGDGITSERL